ncbi:MAG: thiamine pyrophosphate-dependent enzyme [Chloroflexota bacterium]|nr:thiamine pyrophosphate-dependent enzyme [Chloroflexota bacterium]
MMYRSAAIMTVMKYVGASDLVVSTTGMISRELFHYSDRGANFYMLGSMGLSSAVGLGLGLLNPEKKVFILEGDGSSLMSLGTIPLIASERPSNLVHVIFDNQCYESTGGQPSISRDVDIADIADVSGYAVSLRLRNLEALESSLDEYSTVSGPILLLVECQQEEQQNVPRVSYNPTEIRDTFKRAVNQID